MNLILPPGAAGAACTAASVGGPRPSLAWFAFLGWNALFFKASLISLEYRGHLLGHPPALPRHQNSILWPFKLRPSSTVSGSRSLSSLLQIINVNRILIASMKAHSAGF